MIVYYIASDKAVTLRDIPSGWVEEWAPSYILIPPNQYIGDDLKVTVAHEFNHAVQMAYSHRDIYESVVQFWFGENTATLMSEETWNYQYKYYNTFWNIFADPLSTPQKAMNDMKLKYSGFL